MKSLAALMVVTGLVLSTVAFAAPKALSSADLDKVSAGSGVMDWFLGGTGGPTLSSVPEDGVNIEDNAVAGNNAVAVVGDENRTGVFAEDNDDSAVALGEGNKAQYVDQGGADYALATGDNAQICLDVMKVDYEIEDVEDGAAFIGDNNEVYVDNSEMNDNEIEDDGYGVIAREACVTDSFNVQDTDIDVEVDIEDSFNCETNSLEVSPCGPVSAIVFAGSLGFQGIGVNLNVTNATAQIPTMQGDASANIPVIAGNALAVTIQSQTNFVNTVIVGVAV